MTLLVHKELSIFLSLNPVFFTPHEPLYVAAHMHASEKHCVHLQEHILCLTCTFS